MAAGYTLASAKRGKKNETKTGFISEIAILLGGNVRLKE